MTEAEKLRETFVAGTRWAWGENRHRATRQLQADVEALRRFPDAAKETPVHLPGCGYFPDESPCTCGAKSGEKPGGVGG